MSMKTGFSAALAGLLCLAAQPTGLAQLIKLERMGPETRVQVHMDATGEATISAWSSNGGNELVPVLAQVLDCRGGVKPDPYGTNEVRCLNGLRRDGLLLEGAIDLAPIARKLAATDVIDLWVDYPQLGYASASAPLEEQGGPMRASATARFAAGSAPLPIHIQFGYRSGELAGVYLPLIALALALTLMAFMLARIGGSGLSRSMVLVGVIVWMGAASQLQVGALIHILLFRSSLANLAALMVEFWPPLLCVAVGVALGSPKTAGQRAGAIFREVFWSMAVIPLILASVIGALPSMMQKDWLAAAPWLLAAPLFVLLRRALIRNSARASVKLLTGGELRERVSALVTRAGRPPIKLFISYLRGPQVSIAFTLPGKSIFLTAPLVRSLSKREVDAVAAHELAHFKHSNRAMWMALMLAMVLFETPVNVQLLSVPGGLLAGIVAPLIVLFAALHGMRRREFFADRSAAALTGDPRAMISSLARISRNNKTPLDMNRAAVLFSSHPPVRKRVWALAAAACLSAHEVEALCATADPGDSYELPAEETGGAIFTPAWQKMNAGIYGWAVVLGSPVAGLLAAWLVWKSGTGIAQLLGGIVLGCLLIKGLAAGLMASNFARLRRRLEARLGVSGQLVGLAMDSEPRLYDGRRFSDCGLLSFPGGRLCYQSERTTIALNPADVGEVSTVAASPSNWMRQMPMVRFRLPESGEAQAFILHPVSWIATERLLLRSIERWRATGTSAGTSTGASALKGFTRIQGQIFQKVPVTALTRAILFSGGLALAPAIALVLILHAGWWFVGYALAVTACVHIFMFLPSLTYRPPRLSAELTTPASAG